MEYMHSYSHSYTHPYSIALNWYNSIPFFKEIFDGDSDGGTWRWRCGVKTCTESPTLINNELFYGAQLSMSHRQLHSKQGSTTTVCFLRQKRHSRFMTMIHEDDSVTCHELRRVVMFSVSRNDVNVRIFQCDV